MAGHSDAARKGPHHDAAGPRHRRSLSHDCDSVTEEGVTFMEQPTPGSLVRLVTERKLGSEPFRSNGLTLGPVVI